MEIPRAVTKWIKKKSAKPGDLCLERGMSFNGQHWVQPNIKLMVNWVAVLPTGERVSLPAGTVIERWHHQLDEAQVGVLD